MWLCPICCCDPSCTQKLACLQVQISTRTAGILCLLELVVGMQTACPDIHSLRVLRSQSFLPSALFIGKTEAWGLMHEPLFPSTLTFALFHFFPECPHISLWNFTQHPQSKRHELLEDAQHEWQTCSLSHQHSNNVIWVSGCFMWLAD